METTQKSSGIKAKHGREAADRDKKTKRAEKGIEHVKRTGANPSPAAKRHK
jgi:hypothetical protein